MPVNSENKQQPSPKPTLGRKYATFPRPIERGGIDKENQPPSSTENKAAKEHVKKLQRRNSALSTDLMDAASRAVISRNNLDRLNNENKQLEEKLASSEQNLADLEAIYNSKIKQLNCTIKHLKDKLENHKKAYKKDLELKNAELSDTTTKFINLKIELSKAQKALNKSIEEKNSEISSSEDFTKMIAAFKQKLLQLEQEKPILKAHIKHLEDNLLQLEQKNDELNKQNISLALENKGLNAELEKQEDLLNEEFLALQLKLDQQFALVLKEKEEKISHLEKELEQFIKNASATIKAKEDQIKSLNTKHTSIKDELTSAKLDAKEKENKALRDEIALLKAQLKDKAKQPPRSSITTTSANNDLKAARFIDILSETFLKAHMRQFQAISTKITNLLNPLRDACLALKNNLEQLVKQNILTKLSPKREEDGIKYENLSGSTLKINYLKDNQIRIITERNFAGAVIVQRCSNNKLIENQFDALYYNDGKLVDIVLTYPHQTKDNCRIFDIANNFFTEKNIKQDSMEVYKRSDLSQILGGKEACSFTAKLENEKKAQKIATARSI